MSRDKSGTWFPFIQHPWNSAPSASVFTVSWASDETLCIIRIRRGSIGGLLSSRGFRSALSLPRRPSAIAWKIETLTKWGALAAWRYYCFCRGREHHNGHNGRGGAAAFAGQWSVDGFRDPITLRAGRNEMSGTAIRILRVEELTPLVTRLFWPDPFFEERVSRSWKRKMKSSPRSSRADNRACLSYTFFPARYRMRNYINNFQFDCTLENIARCMHRNAFAVRNNETNELLRFIIFRSFIVDEYNYSHWKNSKNHIFCTNKKRSTALSLLNHNCSPLEYDKLQQIRITFDRSLIGNTIRGCSQFQNCAAGIRDL